MALVVEAYSIGDLCDVDATFTNEACSLFQTEVADKLSCRDACDFFHLAMELGSTDTNIIGKFLYVEVRIRKIVIDAFHDALHKGIVVGFDFYIFYGFFLTLTAGEFSSQSSDVVYQIIYEDVKFLHIKRFCQESVGSLFESFQTVTYFTL